MGSKISLAALLAAYHIAFVIAVVVRVSWVLGRILMVAD